MKMKEFILLLDHWVFQKYATHQNPSKEDDAENSDICKDILKDVRDNGHYVAVDQDCEIITDEWQQYQNVEFIRNWIKYIVGKGYHKRIAKSEIEKPIIDPDDQHYAEIAKDSEASIMISGDQPLKQDINDRKDIDLGIWNQHEGIALLQWYNSK